MLSLGRLKPKKKLDKAVETKGLMMARFSFKLQGFFFKNVSQTEIVWQQNLFSD